MSAKKSETILVTGRKGSGKSTFIEEWCAIRLAFDSNHPILDLSGDKLVSHPALKMPDTRIIVVQTPAILCSIRSNVSFDLEQRKQEDAFLSHMTELPNCTIIKNDGTISDFRVKIKKYIRSI